MYDVVIIGCGPAGLTAGIFSARRKLKTLIVGEILGGQMALARTIENYPGFDKISGIELAEKMYNQAKKFGCEIKFERVVNLELQGEIKKITTEEAVYEAKTVIIATGRERRKLGIGEDKFLGKGVSYCALCDGLFFEQKNVAVIGWNDSAINSALYLSEICKKVYLIYGSEIRAEEVNLEKLKEKNNIEFVRGVVKRIEGDEKVKGVLVESVESGEEKLIEVEGIFIEIGYVPAIDLAKKAGIVVEGEYIKTDKEQKTNIPGVFAAGDVAGGLKQIVKACGEGAVAANSAYKFLKER
jgi:thioredoxin reductase (NADPH)